MESTKIRSFKAGEGNRMRFANVEIEPGEDRVNVYVMPITSRSTMIMCDHADVYLCTYKDGHSDHEIECYDAEGRLIALASSERVKADVVE